MATLSNSSEQFSGEEQRVESSEQASGEERRIGEQSQTESSEQPSGEDRPANSSEQVTSSNTNGESVEDGQVNNEQINERSESESSDEWTDSVEDMDAAEQTNLIKEVKEYWVENKISAPKVNVYELEKAEQWADWRFKMRSHFMCYRLTELIDNKFCSSVKATADYKKLNQFAVMNLGMNLSPALRSLVGADSEIDAETVWQRLVVQFDGQGTTQAIRCFGKIVRLMNDKGGSLSETIATIREVKAKFDEHKNDGETLWKAILVNALPAENEVLQTIISTQPETKSLEDLFTLALQTEHTTAIEEQAAGRSLLNRVTTKRDSNGNAKNENHQLRCFFCGRSGHFKRNCELYKRQTRKNGEHSDQPRPQKPSNNNNNTSKPSKRFQTNCLIAKDVIDEEVMELNPEAFAKAMNAHLVYKPQQYEPDSEIEVLDLNPAEFVEAIGAASRTDDEELQLNWQSFGNWLKEEEPEHDQLAKQEAGQEGKQQPDRETVQESKESVGQQPKPENDPPLDQKLIVGECGKPKAAKLSDHPTRTKTIADSGCNRPMFNSTEGVNDLQPGQGPLFTASNEMIPVEGVGTVTLTTSLNKQIVLKNVLISKKLSANYLAICQFDKANYYIDIWKGRMRFFRDGIELVMIAELDEDDLYEVILIGKNKCNVLIKANDESIVEWHVRFAHAGLDSIRNLRDRLNITIPASYKLECVVCAKGKMIRSPYDNVHVRVDTPLKLIHTDLSGIIRINNPQGYRYFLTFMDDYSRCTFLYLLRSKNEVFATFRQFKKMIEAQLELQVKKLKSDGGSEYDNSKFRKLCEETGMVQNFSAPRCPQQNGGPERLNRTIEQMARCMLIEAGLSIVFWPFAVLYAIFIKNRLPHKALRGKIPLELLYKCKVKFEEIRKFGCRVIYLVDDREITKFDPTGEDGLFMGVPNEYRAYYVYSLRKKIVIVRRHVYFLKAEENQLKDEQLSPNEKPQANEGAFESDEDDSTWLVNAIEQMGFKFVETNFEQESTVEQSNQQSTDQSSDPAVDHPAEQSSTSSVEQQSVLSGEPSVEQSEEQPEDEHQSSAIQQPQPNGQQQIESTQANGSESSPPPDHAESPANEQSSGRQRPESGTELELTKAQKKKLLDEFDNLPLVFVRPVNKGSNKPGAGVYRVNSVVVPRNYNQVKRLEQEELWNQAMERELESMNELGVWKEVDRPKNTKVLPMIWVYRVKYLPDGEIERYKARLCVLGNLQDTKNQSNIYSPVLHEVSLRLLLAFGVHRRMHIHHVDVTTAYLHSLITEEVYVDYPPGMARRKGKCLRLLKSLYGLRSSPKNWYRTITKILIELGFRKSKSDPCVFIRNDADGKLALIGVYVDDLVLLCDTEEQMDKLKRDINKHVTIADKGQISQFLNLEITYNRQKGVLKISQREYLRQTLEQFGMADCSGKSIVCPSGADLFTCTGKALDDASEYLTLVGILIYVSIRSRPDLKFIVSRLCQFMSCATEHHWSLAKHVLKYVKQTIDYAIYYTADSQPEVQIDCDADHANDKTTSRSITGVCAQAFGCLVEWTSNKQHKVAQSTCEAELRAISEGIDSLWYIRNFLEELTDITKIKFKLHCDNQSALLSLKSGGNFSTNKRYRVILNGIIETTEEEWLEVKHKPTGSMVADFLTKSLPGEKLIKLLELVNVF